MSKKFWKKFLSNKMENYWFGIGAKTSHVISKEVRGIGYVYPEFVLGAIVFIEIQ